MPQNEFINIPENDIALSMSATPPYPGPKESVENCNHQVQELKYLIE